jgi:hypothetical protein
MPRVGADITDTSELCPWETRYPQNTVTSSIGTRGKKKFANPARNKKRKSATELSANDTAVFSNCSKKHSISGLIYSKSFNNGGSIGREQWRVNKNGFLKYREKIEAKCYIAMRGVLFFLSFNPFNRACLSYAGIMVSVCVMKKR